MKTGNLDAFFREKCLTKNNTGFLPEKPSSLFLWQLLPQPQAKALLLPPVLRYLLRSQDPLQHACQASSNHNPSAVGHPGNGLTKQRTFKPSETISYYTVSVESIVGLFHQHPLNLYISNIHLCLSWSYHTSYLKWCSLYIT